MTEIQPCPMCGSRAVLDSGGVIECYGHDWQNLYIECKDDMGTHCSMELNLSADFYYIKNADEVSIAAWNALERK